MSYQYLYCPSCGVQRMGHGYRCSVCSGLLRRVDARHPSTLVDLKPLVRATRSTRDTRQPVAA
jgi:hypothetical protein